jgi:hypothetical protein
MVPSRTEHVDNEDQHAGQKHDFLDTNFFPKSLIFSGRRGGYMQVKFDYANSLLFNIRPTARNISYRSFPPQFIMLYLQQPFEI